MKTAIVIPAYNASATIGKIVNKCLALNSTVIVIDNDSTDRTPYEAYSKGVILFKETVRGQGAATRRGWSIAIKIGCDTIVTLDSDGQHNPEEVPSLLQPIKDDIADIVIGSRFITAYKAPKYRKFGIDIINFLYNVFSGDKLTDSQCCFRAYSEKALSALTIEENGFGFSTELPIKARKLGLRVVEVPVSCIYHSNRRMNSTLNPIKHGLIVAWKTVYWRLKLWN